MATTPDPTKAPKAPKIAKAPVSLAERTKAALSTAALRGKVTTSELEMIEQHCAKLRALLA